MAIQKIRSEPPMNDMAPHGAAIIDLLNAAANAIPLASLLWKEVPASTPPQYRYEFTTTIADGSREWKQVVTFPADDIDPPMTFDVPTNPQFGFRAAAEFSHFRDLRARLILLRNEHGLSLFDVDWNDAP
jgi:hypothetical protein